MTIKEKAFSAVRWTTFVTVARIVLQTLQLVVLARLISPQDFGLMAMILSVTAFIQIFADLGVSNSIIHAREISPVVLSTLYWLNVAVGAALSLAIWILSPWVAHFYSEPHLAMPLALSGLSFLFLAIGQQVKVMTEKRLAFQSVALIELTSAIVSTVLTIAAAFWGAGVYALVIGILALSGGNSILYLIFARNGWLPGLHLDFKASSTHLRAGLYLLGTSLANTATIQADVILVGRILGSAALGAYTVPRELCLKVMLATNPIATRVGTPLMAQAQHDKDMLRRVYLSTIRMTASVNFPIYGALAAYRHEITSVVFGPNWVSSADLLGIMAIWGMFRSLGNPVGSLLYGTGNARLALMQSLGVTILILPTVYFGSHWGTAGIAWALTAFYLLFAFILWAAVIRPITGVGLISYSEAWVTPFVIVAASCVLSLLATSQIDFGLLRLVLGLACGGMAYLALSWFFNRRWCSAMMGLLHIRRRRQADLPENAESGSAIN